MESKVRRPCSVNQQTVCQFLHPHHHNHSSYRQVPPPLNHHHHHHHHHVHVSPQCPLHSFMLYSNNHSPEHSLFTSHLQTVSNPPPNIHSLPFSQTVETVVEVGLTNEVNEEWEEEVHDEDPVFVLTDEWREFFAKSEAKRKQAKKQKAKLKCKEKDV